MSCYRQLADCDVSSDLMEVARVRDDLWARMQALVRRLAFSARASWPDGERAARERAWGRAATVALGEMRGRFGEAGRMPRAVRPDCHPRAALDSLLRDSQPWYALLAEAGA